MDKTVEMEMKLTIARRDLKKLLASELITATMIKGSLAKTGAADNVLRYCVIQIDRIWNGISHQA